MTRSNRSTRTATRLNDFQVFKGRCGHTMQAFGGPVMAQHVARLLVRDDQANAAPGTRALYAIYQRSENRILEILQTDEAVSVKLAA